MKTVNIHESQIQLIPNRSGVLQSARFAQFSFEVGKQCEKLLILMDYESVHQAQIPLCLFDPEGNIRIIRASEGTHGPARKEFFLTETSGSKGAIPGPIHEGTWKLIIYKRRFSEEIGLNLHVEADYREIGDTPRVITPSNREHFSSRCLDSPHKSHWYCGELHLHSHESTGRTSVERIVEVAKEKGLDFLSLTDHFAASHWLRIQELKYEGTPLFLQSMEVSGDRGHANIHGIKRWINPLVDDNEELSKFLALEHRPTMESIADEVHEQGGLFSINHALSGNVAWRYADFPIEKADLFEIWCTPDNATTFLYPTMWDMLMCQGYRLTGVGSSDSHNPSDEGPWQLGNIRTWVHAEQLSQPAILSALKKGRAYVAIGKANMSFSAETGSVMYEMGDTIACKEETLIRFIVNLINHTSGNLFVIASGIIFDVHYVEAGSHHEIKWDLRLKDIHRFGVDKNAYVRIEFHEDVVKAKYWGMAWRDHKSMRLLGNPIWISQEKG